MPPWPSWPWRGSRTPSAPRPEDNEFDATVAGGTARHLDSDTSDAMAAGSTAPAQAIQEGAGSAARDREAHAEECPGATFRARLGPRRRPRGSL
eukprot:5448101-Pyramimonas_sp.AAC.1